MKEHYATTNHHVVDVQLLRKDAAHVKKDNYGPLLSATSRLYKKMHTGTNLDNNKPLCSWSLLLHYGIAAILNFVSTCIIWTPVYVMSKAGAKLSDSFTNVTTCSSECDCIWSEC